MDNFEVYLNEDSIQFYQDSLDYESANRLILNRLSATVDSRLDEKLHFWILLFSNYLSLKDNDAALKTSLKIDSLIDSNYHSNLDVEDLGLYYHKKGVLHYKIYSNKTSIQSYSKAIEYRTEANSEIDLSVIKSLKNLGIVYYQAGDLKSAARTLTLSIDRHLKRTDRDDMMLQDTYAFLSFICIEMDDMERGWKYLQSSIILAEKLYGHVSVQLAELYSHDVTVYYDGINDVKQMIIACQKAESILNKLNQKDQLVQSLVSNNYNNFGLAYERLGDVSRAEKYFLKSSFYNKSEPDRIYFLIDNYLNLGSLFLESRQFENADTYISLIKTHLSADIDSTFFGLYHYHKAELLRHQENYKQSESNFVKALRYFNAYENPNLDKIKNGLPSYLDVLFDYAMMFSDQYEQSGDIEHLLAYDSIYTKIDKGIQAMRKDFKSQESRVFLSSKVKIIYEHVIDVYYTLYEKTNDKKFAERCFEIAEKNKSLAILEDLVNRRSLIDSELPEELLSKIEGLENELTNLNFLKDNNKKNSQVNEKIIKTDLELDRLINDISNAYPQYNLLKYDRKETNINEYQIQLKNVDCAVIQYFMTDHELYVMFLDEDDFHLKRTAIDSSFIMDVLSFRSLIDDSADKVKFNQKDRQQLYADFLMKSQTLYQYLIQPIESKFKNRRNIIVIPDKHIGYIPFDVLSSTGLEDDFLVYSHNVSYAYSMALYEWMVTTTHDSKHKTILGFAPSFNESVDLSALPFSATEIKQIDEEIQVNAFVNEAATKDNFLSSYQDYNIIHLSTHGIVNHTKPSYSYIAFTEHPDSTELSHYLFANEIFNLNSNAELLVLSACETAIGEIADGEGIMSLSRAWASTGVKSIISTLWKIDDQFTSQFMLQFYKRLKAGDSKSVALWNTKKSVLQNETYKHPYYWSSMTLMGDTGQINLGGTSVILKNLFIALGCIVFLCLCFGLYRKFSRAD